MRRVGIWQVVLRNFSIKFFLIFDFYRLNFSFSLIHFFLITCLCKIYRFIATINHSVIVIYYLRIKRVKKETLSVVTLLPYEVPTDVVVCIQKKSRTPRYYLHV
jgi:hypothetical protein